MVGQGVDQGPVNGQPAKSAIENAYHVCRLFSFVWG